jgi:hypothetical protein
MFKNTLLIVNKMRSVGNFGRSHCFLTVKEKRREEQGD